VGADLHQAADVGGIQMADAADGRREQEDCGGQRASEHSRPDQLAAALAGKQQTAGKQ
jgi:hypothetical protein